jgi:hypothetical protein
MSLSILIPSEKSRLRALLDHFSMIEDPREAWRVAHPLPEVLLLVVCGTIADCDDYEGIAAWGKAHLGFLQRFLPYYHGVPGARWLTLLMNRIDPALFSAAFTAWVRETWPDQKGLIAIDGKTSRRSHDRGADKAPLHLVSAFLRPPAASCLANRRSPTNPMKPQPFRSCSSGSPKTTVSKELWSRSTPSRQTPPSRRRSGTLRPTISWP